MRVHTLSMKMVVGIFAILFVWGTAGAAGFPERPIQVLVGWPVGSLNDTLDRAIVKPLAKILKQPVIIQNVPGGGGALVLGRVKTEKPDGYTLFQTGSNMYSQIPWMRPVPFDPLKDFAYLAQHVQAEHYLLCRSDSPWMSFEDLIQYVKKNPNKVTYTTTGVGTSYHILMEYLAIKENMRWIHVPNNSAPEAITALLGGHVGLATVNLSTEMEHVKAGRLRPLLCLNNKRLTALPDLPTVVEKGYDFSCVSSWTWSVPVKTPKDIQKILEKAVLQAVADPDVREVMRKLSCPYAPLGSEALTKALFLDHEKFGELMKKLGLGIFKK